MLDTEVGDSMGVPTKVKINLALCHNGCGKGNVQCPGFCKVDLEVGERFEERERSLLISWV